MRNHQRKHKERTSPSDNKYRERRSKRRGNKHGGIVAKLLAGLRVWNGCEQDGGS